jgi:hypothetical protein
MSKARLAVFALFASMLASPAAAQICASFPTMERQFSFGASLGFPEGGDQWGVEASYNFLGPLAFFGGMDVFSAEGGDESDETFYGGASFGADSLLSLPANLSACLVGRVGYNGFEGGSSIQVPLGFGVGTTLSVTPTTPVMVYVIPQFIISRFSVDALDIDETETDIGLQAGGMAGFGMFFGGAEVRHVFTDGGDTTFAIRAGIRL